MYPTINEKGQITIPVDMRRAFNLKPGDRVRLQRDKDRITLRPYKTLELDDIVGMLGKPPNGRSLSLEEMDDAMKDAVAEHVMSSLKRDDKA